LYILKVRRKRNPKNVIVKVVIQIANYIDGKLIAPLSGQYIPNIDPSTGTQYGTIPDSEADDVSLAIDAASHAFPAWSALTIEVRSEWLQKIANGITSRMEEFVSAEFMDNGKPRRIAGLVDIPRAIQNFTFFSHAITQFSSESHATNDSINYTLRQPLGVVTCISPWNLPLYLFTWKIAPALAMGNTVVAKPSEVTPYTAYLLSQVCNEIGLPPGVLNIVHGYGYKLGDRLCTDPIIKAVSFTGGTVTGRIIASMAAPLFKKISLELGGKNPTIIFDDCDYDDMLKTVVRSSFSNQGQICLCGSRILVHRSIYQKFKADFVNKVSALKVGDPMDDQTSVGALVSKQHFEKVQSYISLAREEGGKILTGGHKVTVSGRCENGYFLQPCVIEGLPNDCRTNQEEIFGPVVTIMPFDTDSEALHLANGNAYGLATSVWTGDISRAHRLGSQLDFGIVWINCWMLRDLRTPFGGMKQSGVGREGGQEVLRFFSEPKNICIKY
jgi:aminomuconate-semialdehyde/2-hydroxymuconate-6-semialdehyde dehydrogenase